MTISEALQITGIRENELQRINKAVLNDVIEHEEKEATIFPYDNSIKRRIEAYKTIRKEIAG